MIDRGDGCGKRFILDLTSGGALAFSPAQKFPKQDFALFLGKVRANRAGVAEECRKLAAGDLLLVLYIQPQFLQRFVGGVQPGPARNGCGQIDVLPFRVTRRLAKLVELREQCIDELLHAAISVSVLLPVERCEHGRHRDSIRRLSFRHQRRILRTLEFAERVEICERLGKRNGYEMKSGIGGYFRKEIDRPADYADERGEFT